MRRGVLWMLMAGALYLFEAQGSFSLPAAVSTYFLPLLFLSGLGLTIFGLIRWFR